MAGAGVAASCATILPSTSATCASALFQRASSSAATSHNAPLRDRGRGPRALDPAVLRLPWPRPLQRRRRPDQRRQEELLRSHRLDGQWWTSLHRLWWIAREAIESRGATLRYLPQYSPDLNPIEMPFSKLKADLRKAAERTVPRLCRRIGSFARRLSAGEALNYFRHAGYA
jgi:transposase